MASEIRTNLITSRAGLSTISLTSTGPIFAGIATFTGSIGIAGTLTYEDVTNIDSVGVITARSGIRVGANGTKRETVHLDAGDSGANYLRFTNTTTGNGTADGFNVGINADEEALIWNFENKPTIFATGNSERLLITSDGNIEIDSFNSPSTRTLSLRTAYLANANGGIGLAAKDHSGSAADGLGVYGTDGVSIHTANAGTVYERLRIDTDGKVIVGNSGTKFGNAAVQAFVQHGNTAGESGFSSVDTTSVAAGVGGEIAFHGKYNTGAQDWAYFGHVRGIKENATAGNTACALTFHTRPNATAPQERMRISSEGYVTKPNTVNFQAYNGADVTSQNNYMIFTSTNWNDGGGYDTSNGVFTAPVTGTYLFTLTGLYTKNNSSATWKLVWHVNNVNQGVAAEYQSSSLNNSYNTIGSSSIIYKLTAGQTMRLYVEATGTFHVSGGQTRFCGYLIG